MSLCERPTHWLPQNPLSFIINKLLLIIQALLHTMHVLYMKGRRERYSSRQGERRQWGGKMAGMRGRVEMWDLQKGIKKKKRFWVRGRRGWDLSPVALIHIQSISISSSLSSPSHHTLPLPLFIFLLKCSNFYGLGENRETERERKREQRERERGESGSKDRPMIAR